MKLNKLFAGVLAAAMMMSVGVSAMAETDPSKLTVTKRYTVTNSGTSTVAETFSFTIAPKEGTPALKSDTGSKTVAFDELTATSTGTFEVNFADLNLTEPGVYEYTLTETASENAGVVTAGAHTMKVTAYYAANEDTELSYKAYIYNAAGTKVTEIENVYNAGELNLKKVVTGEFGSKNEEFEFTITLTGESGKNYQTLNVDTTVRAGTTNTNTNPTTIAVGTATKFYLKHGDSLSIANLPYGVTYAIVETKHGQDGYTTSITGNPDDMKINAATTTVTFTNDKGGTVETGVVLDNAPYILMLAVVAGGAFFMVAKKRREE